MGIKTLSASLYVNLMPRSEKPPHHMGIKTIRNLDCKSNTTSEKPPHHMGIKTPKDGLMVICRVSL